MNDAVERWRRDTTARDAAVSHAPRTERPGDAERALRCGVARIGTPASPQGAGSYTVTEQWWDGDAQVWSDAYQPVAHTGAVAHDVNGRSSGQVGQRVPFWEQRTRGGQVRLFIDVSETGDETWISVEDDGTIRHVGPGSSHCCGGSKNNYCIYVTHIDGDQNGHLREFTVVDTTQVPAVFSTYSFIA